MPLVQLPALQAPLFGGPSAPANVRIVGLLSEGLFSGRLMSGWNIRSAFNKMRLRTEPTRLAQ